MKNTTTLILFLLFLFHIGNAQQKIDHLKIDHLKIGQQIEFSSQDYSLSRSAKPYNNYFIQEYIKADQTITDFNKSIVMIAIIDTTTVDNLAATKLAELKKLKKQNKTLEFQVLFNEEGGRIIEFSISNGQYHFWNIQRYTVQKLKDGRDVGIMYTYVERELISDKWSINDIQRMIDEKRVGYITEVGAIEIPVIDL